MLWPFIRRRRKRYNAPAPLVKEEAPVIVKQSLRCELPTQLENHSYNGTCTGFAAHLLKYKGETVTIFVAGGGFSGLGFTGVLLHVCNAYIALITKPGPAPACSLGNSCSPYYLHGYIPAFYYPQRYLRYSVGAVTNIPIDKIVSFVHNAI